ncbi:MAG: YbaB/EbfC family nucleoid-associated protein [Clostridia bacterium]|nr:YbaB/EbfC family nucleoid-associated protein [Clostridia bacterium]MBR2966771.1 YbaB/EbfC family nucleoid-associated protein [Clostridia bacterium]
MAKGNKYGYNGAGGSFGGGGGMQSIMQQAQQMQQKLQQAQERLEELEVTGTSGGGMVTVTATGKKLVTGIKLNVDQDDFDDVEMLEDLILVAINDAYSKAQAEEDKVMAPFAAMKGLF